MRGYWSYPRISYPLAFFTLLVAVACAEPTLNVVQNSREAVLNEPYTLAFELSWQGKPDEFVAIPPSLQLDSWAEISEISTSSFVEGDQSTLRHTVTLIPREVGEFSTPAFELAYLAKADIPKETPKDTDAQAAPGPLYGLITAGPLTVRVNEPSDAMIQILGIVTLCLVLFGSAFVFYRRNAIHIATASEPIVQTVPSYIHDARKHRLDEDHYAFFQSLAGGAGLLHNSEERRLLKKRFSDLAMALGFKGAKVTADELDGALRELEGAAKTDINTNQD